MGDASLSPSCLPGTAVPTCDKISPDRVWDVQWSGNPPATSEQTWGFAAPYNPSTGLRVSIKSGDYFTLTWTGNDRYQLKLMGDDGTEKSTFPEGKVKADSEVVFYIVTITTTLRSPIRYITVRLATIITKEEHHAGDAASFSDLITNPSRAAVESALGGSCLDYLV